MSKTFIIAEAGTTNDGDLDHALRAVEEAKRIGADAIKFQMFKAEEVVSSGSPFYKFFKNREFEADQWREIQNECKRLKIEFMVSVFGNWSAELYKNMGGKTWKIASRSQRNWKLIENALNNGEEVYISTGMDKKPISAYLDELSSHFTENETDKITLLHCVSKYPTLNKEANLKNIDVMNGWWNRVGYSDHTVGYQACLSAVAKGVTVIEKHFNPLNTSVEHPDFECGLSGYLFSIMVEEIRKVEVLNG